MPEQIPLMVDAATQELRQFTSDETIPRGQLLSALQVALTGLVTSDVSGVLASDTILQAIGKLQAQASGKADNSTVGQAIAMAATFTTVPTTFQAWTIVVTQPHLRLMVWNTGKAKYVRAPWHRPGRLFFSHHSNNDEPGALLVRADVSYNQADYPDLSEVLGLSGTGTFTLFELRGEFVRVLDNGRGIDVGRVHGTFQGHAMQAHTHYRNPGQFVEAGFTNRQSGNDAAQVGGARTYDLAGAVTGAMASGTSATETRPRNIALPLWVTY